MGYAPAYIVHDWLFVAQHCGYEPDNQHTFGDAVAVIAEGLKAVMEANTEVRNYFVFDSVVAAVGSPIAKRLWKNGSCKEPPIPTFKRLTKKPFEVRSYRVFTHDNQVRMKWVTSQSPLAAISLKNENEFPNLRVSPLLFP